MEKKVKAWSVRDLRERFSQIDFPEYQREPNLWSLVEKQRLIDSIVRRFDIASLYLYKHDDGSIDCVDGRQRIGTIMAFLGEFPSDTFPDFRFRHLNEIFDETPPFRSLEGKTFKEINQLCDVLEDETAKDFLDSLLEYPLTVVMLSDSKEPEEFNLQFIRLNLGTIISSGEKLNAMVGDLRDACFEKLGMHPFLEGTKIPTRRFAREQVAAQILAQMFSIDESKRFTRTRHIDLQRLFKQNSTLSYRRQKLVDELSKLLSLLAAPFSGINALRNRAITVSTVLLAWKSGIETPEAAIELAEFLEEFVIRLKWQIGKGLSIDEEYHYLIDFQRSITQASAESSSVETRADLLEEEHKHWLLTKKLKGDEGWEQNNPGCDPRKVSRLELKVK